MVANPKPAKPIKDRAVYTVFHERGHRCCSCTHHNPEAHHIVHRSLGGDDVIGNLAPLCRICHEAYHRHHPIVRRALATWIRSQLECCNYLIHKKGVWAAENFLLRLEGKIEL